MQICKYANTQPKPLPSQDEPVATGGAAPAHIPAQGCPTGFAVSVLPLHGRQLRPSGGTAVLQRRILRL